MPVHLFAVKIDKCNTFIVGALERGKCSNDKLPSWIRESLVKFQLLGGTAEEHPPPGTCSPPRESQPLSTSRGADRIGIVGMAATLGLD